MLKQCLCNLWNRLSFFDCYLLSRSDEFDDSHLFKLRLQRTILLHVRGAISQEFYIQQDTKVVKANIAEVLNTDHVKELFAFYPFNKLPLRHRVFYFCVKIRCYLLMKLMFRLKNNLG